MTLFVLSASNVVHGCQDEAMSNNNPPMAVEQEPTLMIAPAIILNAHNARREAHNVPDLTWSDELQHYAQAWADNLAATSGCGLQHDYSGTGMGENLYMCSGTSPGCASGSNSAVSIDDPSAGWYESEKTWPLTQPSHLTQLIWASSSRVGCAVNFCHNNGFSTEIVVCRYLPPGNVETQYEANVFPATTAMGASRQQNIYEENNNYYGRKLRFLNSEHSLP
jgi:uncharacterized protein YkwD